MTRMVTVAATQMQCDWDRQGNIARAEKLIRDANARGAEIVLVQELFETPYFCQDVLAEFFDIAAPFEDNPLIAHFQALAAELEVVLPISYFERAGQSYFNSIAVIDADGTVLGNYRKSHIPDGVGYYEKFYFSPGDTGFKVWDTRYARIGVGICWDQWFPEAARAMVLKGAELLLYPTAIGSEPHDPSIDSAAHWRRTMQGHSAANMVPVIASNRIGEEAGRKDTTMTFYGTSFITDGFGDVVESAGRTSESVLVSSFDLDTLQQNRTAWGLFRDRRPELYAPLMTYDAAVNS